jgi:hypothetical protein
VVPCATHGWIRMSDLRSPPEIAVLVIRPARTSYGAVDKVSHTRRCMLSRMQGILWRTDADGQGAAGPSRHSGDLIHYRLNARCRVQIFE